MLTPLARVGLMQRVSIFTDDVMVFVKPSEIELQMCGAILEAFGTTAGLRVNWTKSSAMPIRCADVERARVV